MSTGDDSRLAAMHQARGYVMPEHEFLARHHPSFLEAYDGFVGEALLHHEQPAELEVKYRELVVSGILAFRGSSEPAIARHLKRAVDAGATEGEVLEAFEAAMVPGGAPTFLRGVRALMLLRGDSI